LDSLTVSSTVCFESLFRIYTNHHHSRRHHHQHFGALWDTCA